MASQTPATAGTVATLWRYPVKSMMGEELNAAAVTDRGLLGDRAYALVDLQDGKVASAKNPRKWPRLFAFRAAYLEPPEIAQAIPPVRIALPDGATITSRDHDVDQVVSAAVGRQVALRAAPPEKPSLEEYWPDMEELDRRDTVTDEAMPTETFFDAAPLHLVTTATLDTLGKSYPEGRFEVRRFRPNLVIEAGPSETGFPEDAWLGRTIRIGNEVRISVTGPCPRCVMTTLAQGDLPADPGILRTAARQHKAHVGVYAKVLRGGIVRRGDLVAFEEQ
ncbi:MAG: MOSC domain-containing protein [Pirellulales bacterium]|nr:MOSC domain-containing protein [Pirellulales bacterium]